MLLLFNELKFLNFYATSLVEIGESDFFSTTKYLKKLHACIYECEWWPYMKLEM